MVTVQGARLWRESEMVAEKGAYLLGESERGTG